MFKESLQKELVGGEEGRQDVVVGVLGVRETEPLQVMELTRRRTNVGCLTSVDVLGVVTPSVIAVVHVLVVPLLVRDWVLAQR